MRIQELAAGKPTERLKVQLQLLNEHESIYKDSLIPLANRSISLAQSIGNKTAEGYAVIGLVHALMRNDQLNDLDSLLTAALVQYPITDERFAPIHLRLHLEYTNLLASSGEYQAAVNGLLSIVQIAEIRQDIPALCQALNELGVISYNRNDLEKALEYYKRALSYNASNSQALQTSAYSYINMAMVYAWNSQFDSAFCYLKLAKPISEKIENLYYLANAYMVEANTYKWSGNMPRAEQSILKMVALRKQTEGDITFSNEQLGLANFYVYAKNYPKAISIYNAGLARSENDTVGLRKSNYELLLRYYEGLAKCYKVTGKMALYETALQNIIAYKDSLNSKNSVAAIAEMQTRYEVQKKENTIIVQKLDLARKNFLFFAAIILAAFMAAAFWLLFRNYRRKSKMKLYLQKEEDILREKEAVRLAEESERKRIAADLHDNLGSYAACIKSNTDELQRNSDQKDVALLSLLQSNAQQMVSLLSDTIWVLRKEEIYLRDIGDRLKLMIKRLQENYPNITFKIVEDFEVNVLLPYFHRRKTLIGYECMITGAVYFILGQAKVAKKRF